MDSNSPIGVFDSGLGGLTVLKELRRLLPHENFIFVGDSARAPYGSRTPEEIISFLQQFMDYFQSRGVKMAVCACNTMTSYGYPVIKDKTSFALVPMNPAIIPAVKASANKHIGVIATEATIKKGMHKQAASNLNPQIKVFGVGCPKFVPLIETGHIHDDAIDEAVQEYANKFKTFIGLFDVLILFIIQSQFTACSGNNPVCLNPIGFILNVKSLYFICHCCGIFLLYSQVPPPVLLL